MALWHLRYLSVSHIVCVFVHTFMSELWTLTFNQLLMRVHPELVTWALRTEGLTLIKGTFPHSWWCALAHTFTHPHKHITKFTMETVFGKSSLQKLQQQFPLHTGWTDSFCLIIRFLCELTVAFSMFCFFSYCFCAFFCKKKMHKVNHKLTTGISMRLSI